MQTRLLRFSAPRTVRTHRRPTASTHVTAGNSRIGAMGSSAATCLAGNQRFPLGHRLRAAVPEDGRTLEVTTNSHPARAISQERRPVQCRHDRHRILPISSRIPTASTGFVVTHHRPAIRSFLKRTVGDDESFQEEPTRRSGSRRRARRDDLGAHDNSKLKTQSSNSD
jgi:hypothetical protein